MIGPADLEAWSEDADASCEPIRTPAEERLRRHRLLLARAACGRPLSPSEWRELKAGVFGR